MTKLEALKQFKHDYPDYKFADLRSGRLDRVARCECWNNWTDALCRAGEITMKQYEGWTNPF